MAKKTSLAAILKLTKTGAVADQQMIAWRTLYERRPMTGRELQAVTGIDGIWKRLSELKAIGLVVEHEIKICTVTGRSAIAWRAVFCEPTKPRRKPVCSKCGRPA